MQSVFYLPLSILLPGRVPPVVTSSEASSRRTSRIRSFRLTLISSGVPINGSVGVDLVDGPGGDSSVEKTELTNVGGGGGRRSQNLQVWTSPRPHS